jgi:hypothetical protein
LRVLVYILSGKPGFDSWWNFAHGGVKYYARMVAYQIHSWFWLFLKLFFPFEVLQVRTSAFQILGGPLDVKWNQSYLTANLEKRQTNVGWDQGGFVSFKAIFLTLVFYRIQAQLSVLSFSQ